MNDLERLVAVEEIKKLRARGNRLVDTHAFEELRDVLADDCRLDLGGSENIHDEAPYIEGVDNIIEYVKSRVGTGFALHLVYAPEIDILTDTTARGLWGAEFFARDKYRPGETHGHAYGRAEDEYEYRQGRWWITSQKLVHPFSL